MLGYNLFPYKTAELQENISSAPKCCIIAFLSELPLLIKGLHFSGLCVKSTELSPFHLFVLSLTGSLLKAVGVDYQRQTNAIPH